jgi:hypothetical protein
VQPGLFQQQNGGCRDDGTGKRHVTGAAQRTGGKDNDSSDLGRAIDIGSTPRNVCRDDESGGACKDDNGERKQPADSQPAGQAAEPSK